MFQSSLWTEYFVHEFWKLIDHVYKTDMHFEVFTAEELSILVLILHQWMLGITYPAMQCHILEDTH